MGDVWLVRHGATEWSAPAGTPRPPTCRCCPRARRRPGAGAAARRARLRAGADLAARRARRTAELAGFPAAEVDDGPGRVGLRRLRGRHHRRDPRAVPGWTVWTHPCPGGETAAQVAARLDRVVARCLGGAGRRACCSATATALRALAARWLRLPVVGGTAAQAGHRDRLGARPRARGRRSCCAGTLDLSAPCSRTVEPMALTVGCPRCATPVAQAGDGVVVPRPRRGRAAVAARRGVVRRVRGAPRRHGALPDVPPWPLSPGWRVTDFAAVGDRGPRAGPR